MGPQPAPSGPHPRATLLANLPGQPLWTCRLLRPHRRCRSVPSRTTEPGRKAASGRHATPAGLAEPPYTDRPTRPWRTHHLPDSKKIIKYFPYITEEVGAGRGFAAHAAALKNPLRRAMVLPVKRIFACGPKTTADTGAVPKPAPFFVQERTRLWTQKKLSKKQHCSFEPWKAFLRTCIDRTVFF